MATVQDALATLQADDAELQQDLVTLNTNVAAIQVAEQAEAAQIADLNAQIAALSADTVTQDQLDALTTAGSDLSATHDGIAAANAAIAAALPAPA